jgi:hypothetical protein
MSASGAELAFGRQSLFRVHKLFTSLLPPATGKSAVVFPSNLNYDRHLK